MEWRKSIAQPVTETKQDNIEEEKAKSTGSDSRHSSLNQVGNSTGDESKKSSNGGNSTGDERALLVVHPAVTMTSAFDPKFEHLMTYYFIAIGDQYDIRQEFIQS